MHWTTEKSLRTVRHTLFLELFMTPFRRRLGLLAVLGCLAAAPVWAQTQPPAGEIKGSAVSHTAVSARDVMALILAGLHGAGTPMTAAALWESTTTAAVDNGSQHWQQGELINMVGAQGALVLSPVDDC